MQSCDLFNVNTEVKLVNEYINEILNSSQPEVTSLKYLSLDECYFTEEEDSTFFTEFYATYVSQMKDFINKMNEGKFNIVTNENTQYEDLIKQYNLEVKEGKQVYYLISGKKVFTSLIVEGGKIISFCPKLHFGEDAKKEQWFINIPYEY